MDYNEACKGLCEREKWEIAKIADASIESYGSEQEEGEIIEVDETPTPESPIQEVTAAAFEQDQVHTRQSASPQRASHKGESVGTVVLHQQSMSEAIHKDMSASIVRLFVQDAIEKEQVNIRPSTSPERGSHEGRIPCIVFVQQSNCNTIQEDMAATPSISSQGVVEDEPSASAERGSHIGETASTASEGRHVDARQSTLHRKCGSHHRSDSPSAYSSSKERHKKRQEGCFRYSDSRWVLKLIEEVCSERLKTLLSRQNGDRKNFKLVQKKHEVEFFQKHVHYYKLRFAHVMPTISYCRMMLPKLHFSILRNRFRKHMKSQLIKFVKQQISDRNKENRIKARWIFEAKAGYLKKLFYVTSLAYGKFKLEKLKCHTADYLDGEDHLKYFNMQHLTTQIEAIASNKESEGIFATDITEPILENTPLLLETNGPTKLGFSVGAGEDMTMLESRSSQSTCAPIMELGKKNGTQTASAAAQNQGGNVERPYACQLDTSAALEPAKAVTTGKSSGVSEPIEKHSPLQLGANGATLLEFSVDVSEEMVTSDSSSSQLTCAPGMEYGEKDGTQITFSAAAQTEGENMESSCAPRFVTSSTSVTVTVSNDTENAAPVSREKRRRISSGNDMLEGPCCMSGRRFRGKDGTHSALSPAAQSEGRDMERSCASDSDKDAALESAMTENTESENTLGGSNEKQTRISSGNNISEVPCSRSQMKCPDKPTSNLCGTTLHQEEPPTARPSPPFVNNSQMIQAEDTGGEEVPSGQLSSSAQVTAEPNMHSNAQSVMNQRHCGSTSQAASRPYQPPGGNTQSVMNQRHCGSTSQAASRPYQPPGGNTQSVMNQRHCGSTSQAASRPYQPPGGNTHPARTEVDSLGASYVLAPGTQLPTGSTSGHFVAEDGFESNPYTIELGRLQKLHDLIAKRHQEKREQLILARQVEMAQAKKKYEELVYNSEVEVLQRRRELKITSDKIYKQQILAEVLQVIFKASAKVVPDSPRGAAQKTTREPNQSSDQRNFQFSAPVSAPASASIYQSPQLSVQASADTAFRQHCVTAQPQHPYMDSSGRSTSNLMNYPSGGMGLAYRRQA